jgi:hypothetical protein
MVIYESLQHIIQTSDENKNLFIQSKNKLIFKRT